ncbi:DAZ-associated 1 [Chlorella sorokiniana]|uniref:DAZ-associated 1 n=1 Tax=Chlorella sorokiniana TaxID=3076 RepID=A0A2P6TPH4_CHLSO|nr:DAZ-associated 1 [Chlorella sorokiniana]|eukprot:PRW55937.1 DAZ-associated 1 [Chlorella sorokiniana]
MSQIPEGSLSGSSHGSLGELASPPEAELSELEQRKVVVLGVPWQTDDATLLQHFSQFGVVEEAQIMREKYTGKSRGFGFVTFRATADALKAVNSEHSIDGRKCEAKFALPEGKVGSARTTRIFVARIPSSVSDTQFRAYFEQFGVCQDCYMPKDPSKQGHRGIGFVTYASPESVELVMGQTHVLNGNEIAIDRATPKEKTALLPGRLSMSQPNLQMAGNSGHGGQPFGYMRGAGAAAGPGGLNNMLLGLGGRQMSHPALPLNAGGMLGSPPGQQVLAGNGSAHGGSYQGGSYHGGSYHGGQSASGSYHGGQSASGSYHGGQARHAGGSYHGGQSGSGSYHGGQASGSYHAGQASGSYHAGQAGGSYGGGQLGGGSYHGGQQQFGSDGSFHGSQAGSNYSAGSLGAMAAFGSATGVNLGLLQAAALQQLNSGAAGLGLESGSPSQLISLLSASTAAASQAIPLARYASAGQNVGSAASSQGDLSSLLASAAGESSVHGGWLRGTLPPPSASGMGTGSGGGGGLGPASARAGPRIFVGKLSKDTTEADVKEHFMRFGYVLDVYLPRDKNNKREHRGFGFVTFETEAAIQRVVAHGPHHIRGSIVAIDSAVPRQEEVVLAMEGHAGLAGGAALGAERDSTAEAIHQLEVLNLEGSGRGRAMLRPF